MGLYISYVNLNLKLCKASSCQLVIPFREIVWKLAKPLKETIDHLQHHHRPCKPHEASQQL